MSESNTIITNKSSPRMTSTSPPPKTGSAATSATAINNNNNNNHHNQQSNNNNNNSPSSSSNNNNNNSSISFISGISHPEHLLDASSSLHRARQDGFDYAVTALPDTVPLLTTTTSKSNGISSSSGLLAARSRTDVTRLESKWWSTSIVGMVVDPPRWNTAANANDNANDNVPGLKEGSQLLEALTCTSHDAITATRKEAADQTFWGMMEWASHMNIPAVILPSVPLVEHSTAGTFAAAAAADSNNKKSNGKKVEEEHQHSSDDEEDIFATEDSGSTAVEGDNGNHQKKRGRVHQPPSKKEQALRSSSNNNNSASAKSSGKEEVVSINNASAKEYARLLTQLSTSSICTSSHVQLWVRVPLTLVDLQAYQLLLARCDHSSSVGCILTINTRIDASDLPAIVKALHIFLGSGNVKAVSWNVSSFLKNKKGFPTLSKSHQFLFGLLYGRLGRTVRTLVEGDVVGNELLQLGGSTSRLHHMQYLRHLRSRGSVTAKLDSEESILETPYLDNLQSPLQPLGDHLEYQTYETFERDPVKYRNYGLAVQLALEDGMAGDNNKFGYLGSTRTTFGQLKRMSDDLGVDREEEEEEEGYPHTMVEVDIYQVTIMVVGAGRGPLVRESIGAVSRVSAKLMRSTDGSENKQRRKALHAKIVAIEKNPSAVLYLQSLKANDPSWNGGNDYNEGEINSSGNIVIPGTSNVSVIGCDMREATSHPILKEMIENEKARADIVVSELLGSFGDNELSPECLDGVQQCGVLKEGCVSVPQSYTAFITPVSSARLYTEAKNQSHIPLNTNEGAASPHVGVQRAMETPYVVRSHAASQTHEEQPCWTYYHPHQKKKQLDEAMDTTTDNRNASADAAQNINNDRHAHLSFSYDPTYGAASGCGYGAVDEEVAKMLSSEADTNNSDTAVTIHGFLGSFHSVLYESPDNEERSSVISIAPHSFSVGMFSWFPLYFPLKEPLRIPPGASVNCSIWRRSDDKRVWYEWCAEVVDDSSSSGEEVIWGTSSVHNPGGRSYHVNK